MTTAQATALIATLALLLGLASAVAGALWWRVRAQPLVRAAWLARELAERQRALEGLLARFESAGSTTPRHPQGPPPIRRVDPPEPAATPGPTLIAVPDLAANPEARAGSAADELARRFGAIWSLADSGAGPEAIARATGQPIGQVELILGLRRQQAAAGGRGG